MGPKFCSNKQIGGKYPLTFIWFFEVPVKTILKLLQVLALQKVKECRLLIVLDFRSTQQLSQTRSAYHKKAMETYINFKLYISQGRAKT